MFAWRDNFMGYTGGDPYWTNVSLLTNFETPQTAFTDSSTNNFALTLQGASTTPIRPNLRTPFANGSGASMYWDGTASWIEMPANAAWSLGTGNFTFEAWVYVTNFSVNFSGYMPIVGWGGGTYKVFRVRPTAFNFQAPNISADYNAAWPSTMVINTWYHVALVRTSTTSVTAYLNGVAGTATTISATAQFGNATDVLQVGYKSDPGYWWGYISNWRLVKGTAVYTGNFTPSTSPLTAISGTSGLLNFTNQGAQNSTKVIDQGPNGFAVTSTTSGNGLQSSPLNPFSTSYPGSIFCETTLNNYVTVASNAAFQYGTLDFTIECWFRLVTIGQVQYIIDQRNNGTATAIIPTLYVNASNNVIYFVNGSDRITGTTTVTTNVWYHVAVARTATSTKLFLNGTQEGSTYSDSNNYALSRVAIGTSGATNTNTLDGYISNVRLSKNFCYYTGNFTPSTTPLTSNATYTSLLTCTGTMGFYDVSSAYNKMTQSGTGAVNTVQQKFSTQSVRYIGTNWSTFADDTSLQLSTGDFTIEGWVYRSATGVQHGLLAKGTSTTGWYLLIIAANNLQWATGAGVLKNSTTTISANTWTYFAICRSGTTGYMFINGVQQGSTYTDNGNYNQTNNLFLGCDRSNANGLNGYLDNIRITKGIARYTASFTPPTTAFPTS